MMGDCCVMTEDTKPDLTVCF